ncbi:hypothetical protein JKL49_09730 [Phenylobacterium sp. 20VBR1]|uniref:Uncharacterized protein n=1 Tax=Phenylobacterium glaciei TaxID=2803784 RepID=A0A941HW28_9CAUL|nr:hypothetical protein [Phenylobacterium glaciei]MBR7619666.1 hypothetical protein [Phenylobacterium glaciei]QQZ48708.1 hypothetical protein JKL49_14635 [Phenylobacterium glaciei]
METINGFQCKDCTDAAYAKKHIDPAHPKDGPFGVNAPEERKPHKTEPRRDPAVVFGGALSNLNTSASSQNETGGDRSRQTSGALVDLRA